MRICKLFFADDAVTFNGEHYHLDGLEGFPKPVQRPHPPLLLGGGADRALRRVGRIADGWISASRHDLRTIGADLELMRGAAREAGRDPERLRFVIRGVPSLTDEPAGADRRPLHGDAGQLREDFERLAEAGVTELFLDLNFDPEVGSPDADPAASMRRAEQLLTTFAPRP